MNVTFFNPGLNYMMENILLFQEDGETTYWSDALYYFFPQLDEKKAKALSFEERSAYLHSVLMEVYEEQKDALDEKVARYNAHFQAHKPQIEAALSDAFQLDARLLFNDLRAYISLNPVSPRFLDRHTFDVFYLNSERGALGISIHEIIHFIWFHVWNQLWQDSYEEYERPSLKWILSEMVVESIMRDERLSSINPYFPREHGGCVYRYFLDMEIDGTPILDTLDKLYKAQRIQPFMQESYAYCLAHEAEIRAHIKQAETQF